MNENLLQNDRPQCMAARQALDLSRPGEGDAAALAVARRHLQSCPECESAVLRNQRLDKKIGLLCRDVPLTGDLQSQLLAVLQIPGEAGSLSPLPGLPSISIKPLPQGVERGPVPVTRSGRVWRRRSVLAAACSVCALGVWFVLQPPRPTLNLDQLTAQAIEAVEPQSLPPEFSGTDVPPLPRTMATGSLRTAPRRLSDDSTAIYLFRLRTPRGRIIEGRLLAVPVAKVVKVPSAASFLGRPAVYLAQGYCSSQWAEGGYAYVCLVKGGEGDLDRLLPAGSVAM